MSDNDQNELLLNSVRNMHNTLKKKQHGAKEERYTRFTKDRIAFFKGVLFLLLVILSVRLFDLQVLSYSRYISAADNEHEISQKIEPARGSIYVRVHDTSDIDQYLVDVAGEKLFPAVTNTQYALIYAVPKSIAQPDDVANQLAPLLGVDKGTLLQKLSQKDSSYQVLARKVTLATADAVKKLKIGGINNTLSTYRFYPDKGLGGQLFGFVGYQGDAQRGLYGLEGYFDDILRGKGGSASLETDALGTLIPLGNQHVQDAVNGSDLVLTIDRTIQLTACDDLTKWVKQHGADGGSIVILNPHTGAIYAMCSVPDYDPENFSKSPIYTYNNPSIFSAYEPGSIFKPLTMSMALDQKKVTPTTTYIDTGEVKIGPYTIKNATLKAYGKQTMMDVLNMSLNTGAIFAARSVGAGIFYDYVKKFGFGNKTGIELDKEVTGKISLLSQKNEIYMATASFGQGITVTPLQIADAYGALANGGKLMQPYIVDEIIKPDGSKIKTQPKMVRQVISQNAASLIDGMLVNVVRDGEGKRAGVDGYYVAGKTGTAQVARSDGHGYQANVTIGSFAGFAPVDNPRFVMLVKIDHPRDVQWAESSAAPLFGQMAQFLLQYFEVPPDIKN